MTLRAKRACNFPECKGRVHWGHYCQFHHGQRKLGKPLTPQKIIDGKRRISRYVENRACSFPGCGRPFDSRGLCEAHARQRRKGQSLRPIGSRETASESRPIQYDEAPCPSPRLKGPCHVFRGHKSKLGYGQLNVNGRLTGSHRLAWVQKHGPIPEGLYIDHMCRNPSCCNVDHLRLVTPRVNALENNDSFAAINARKTHCPKGHEYTPKNTIVRERGAKTGRECRICYNAYRTELKRRRKERLQHAERMADVR